MNHELIKKIFTRWPHPTAWVLSPKGNSLKFIFDSLSLYCPVLWNHVAKFESPLNWGLVKQFVPILPSNMLTYLLIDIWSNWSLIQWVRKFIRFQCYSSWLHNSVNDQCDDRGVVVTFGHILRFNTTKCNFDMNNFSIHFKQHDTPCRSKQNTYFYLLTAKNRNIYFQPANSLLKNSTPLIT